ncbi:tetratricopeptide repeat protein [Inconstantimicrobium mannanitabidum]|uniref:Transcriptional regulator n=1 Tax=Inconstantimicrobium mannanitabidum TaxID=1604901 RepID=A0ACB5RIT4_9CLOT|nr:tetratricopeptide repeat protein [Clostridium sp. TW13]GKX69003.1 transcriptional regulator [Clostridium sp. TW13]
MEILSPGQKIKKIRQEFKINQKDITGNKITRELISIIENDKSALTPAVAEIITDNINRICKDRNIDFHLDSEYLLEDVNFQTNKMANQYLEFLCVNEDNLSKDFSKDIEEIELFLIRYDVPEKKMIIYEKIADILKKQKDYSRSYTYYIKAFENHNHLFNDIKLFNLLQKLGNVCIYLQKYKESLDFNKLALIYNDNVPEDLKFKVLFNTTLAYMNLKEYDKALIEIEHILSTFKALTEEDTLSLNVLKVNCLRFKKFYSDAFNLNQSMLDNIDSNDKGHIALITGNILDIYTVLKDISNIKIYIDKLLYLLKDYDNAKESYYTANCYNQLGISANLIGNKELAIDCYKKSIEIAKHQKDKSILKKSLDELLTLLIKENNPIEINSCKNTILELISLEIIDTNSTAIFKLIDFYNEVNDKDSINSIIKFILDLKEE